MHLLDLKERPAWLGGRSSRNYSRLDCSDTVEAGHLREVAGLSKIG
jgi:hypothetical protein